MSEEQQAERVRVQVGDDGVAVVTLTRGDKHNALDLAMFEGIVGAAAQLVHRNEAEGKVGVLCLAPAEGFGIDDPEKRARIGEDKITVFRRHHG